MRFLLPPGEGQDEGKKEGSSLFHPLTLASSDYAKDKLSRREREFSKLTSIPPKFVPNTIELMASTGENIHSDKRLPTA